MCIQTNCIRLKAGLAAAILCLLTSTALMAQTNVITGTVSDETGPVIGAAVLIKGTTAGTVSGVDGSWSISASPSATLVFDCLGYKNVEVPVANRTVINTILEPDSEMVEETVVVAYGVQKKSLVTGAISSVRGDDLEFTGIMRADDALAGKTAGVQVVSNSGQPGSDVQIYVRGIGTNGTATPVYIVDGMAVSGIEYLNPSDIQSIEVLKDAASSAIYGARGGNGVILITTKRSQEIGRAHV